MTIVENSKLEQAVIVLQRIASDYFSDHTSNNNPHYDLILSRVSLLIEEIQSLQEEIKSLHDQLDFIKTSTFS